MRQYGGACQPARPSVQVLYRLPLPVSACGTPSRSPSRGTKPRPGPASSADPAGVALRVEADHLALDDPVSLQVPRLAGQAAVDHEAVYLQVLLRGELVTRGPAFAYDVFGGPADPPGLLLAPGLHAPILPPRTGHRRTVTRARWISSPTTIQSAPGPALGTRSAAPREPASPTPPRAGPRRRSPSTPASSPPRRRASCPG